MHQMRRLVSLLDPGQCCRQDKERLRSERHELTGNSSGVFALLTRATHPTAAVLPASLQPADALDIIALIKGSTCRTRTPCEQSAVDERLRDRVVICSVTLTHVGEEHSVVELERHSVLTIRDPQDSAHSTRWRRLRARDVCPHQKAQHQQHDDSHRHRQARPCQRRRGVRRRLGS